MSFPGFQTPVIPTPITGGFLGKVTQFFNVGRNGWSESYYVNVSGGTNPVLDIDAAAAQLNYARRFGLAENVNLEAQRSQLIGPAGFSGLGDLNVAPNQRLGSGAISANCTSPWMGWLISWYDATEFIHDRRIYRGADDASMQGGTVVNGVAIAVPTKIQNFAKGMKNVLTKPFAGPNGGTVRFGIASYDRTTPVQTLIAPGGVTVNGTGNLVFTVSSGDLNIVENSIIHVSVNRQRCVRGVSGRHRVISAPIVNQVQTITTTTRFCCVGADLSKTVGSLRLITNALYPFSIFEVERVVKKSTGRAFFVTAGRRPSKCC